MAVVAAFAYSKIKTPSYQSTSLIEISTTSSAATGTGRIAAGRPSPSPTRSRSSAAPRSSDSAAKLLKDPDVRAVADSVTGTVDATTGALTITGTGSTPERAQAVTKAYSNAFIDQIQSLVQAQIDKISAEINSLQAKINALSARDRHHHQRRHHRRLQRHGGDAAGRAVQHPVRASPTPPPRLPPASRPHRAA